MEKDFINKKVEEAVKQTLEEYRKFAFKQDIEKVCLAVILGGTFDGLIKNISTNLIMPFFDFIINKTHGGWRDYKLVITDGLELGIGKIAGGLLDFAIISVVLFVIFQKIWIKEKQN
jgi:large conductance mechanosensitive channel